MCINKKGTIYEFNLLFVAKRSIDVIVKTNSKSWRNKFSMNQSLDHACCTHSEFIIYFIVWVSYSQCRVNVDWNAVISSVVLSCDNLKMKMIVEK